MRRLPMALALTGLIAGAGGQETLPPLTDDRPPATFAEMWAGFDPRAEPLEVEILAEWEEDGVVLRVLRYRIGVFKGQRAMMAAVYGFPKGGSRLPGLVQIHGGGQYADYRAPLYNAGRGYATISIAWAGRIHAPGYSVNPDVVKLFWEGKTDDPAYRVTTDWGALDAYHAPSRHPETVFPAASPTPWTLDAVESPRNSPWFLCALAARRALTFLEQQPEVDAERLGVYGHSMGGKLTVMTAAADSRVRAAAPSCGGISDRDNGSALFRAGVGDDVSLRHIVCPIVFLSPANDFHGRINDLAKAVREIQTPEWRLTCSAHHNHQDTEPYQVAGPLWFDQHLKGTFTFPQTPQAKTDLQTANGIPTFRVTPDPAASVPLSVDIYYTQQGRPDGSPEDMTNTICRFWHHADAREAGGTWTADLSLLSIDRPLWVYANVLYPLAEPVSGAGYYYGLYTATTFNLSSVMHVITPDELREAGARATREPSPVIETFEGDWRKEWFTYDLTDAWARRTHKLHDDAWRAPPFAKLALDVRSAEPNTLVVGIDDFAAEVPLAGGGDWQSIVLFPTDFGDAGGRSFLDWAGIGELRLGPSEHLRPARGAPGEPRRVGGHWQGAPPEFRNLRWVDGTREERDARRTVKLPEPEEPGAPVFLRDEYADAFASFRPVIMDAGPGGQPLRAGKEVYEHGMTVHAPSDATFFTGGQFARFHALAVAGPAATVEFRVEADGVCVFDSGSLEGHAFREIDLPITGVREIRLLVTDGGNGKGGDWAHWVDARVDKSPP